MGNSFKFSSSVETTRGRDRAGNNRIAFLSTGLSQLDHPDSDFLYEFNQLPKCF
jgi:hypothetical protein